MSVLIIAVCLVLFVLSYRRYRKYSRAVSLINEIELSSLPRKYKAYLIDNFEYLDNYDSIKSAYERLLDETRKQKSQRK